MTAPMPGGPDAGGVPRRLTRGRLRTPRAAAIAGILFSGLLICSLWLLRLSVPSDPLETGAWLARVLGGSHSL